jgi:hypothetical protein
MEKVDGTDADKSERIKFEFLMDPNNLAYKYSQQFAIFKNGCPEDWIKKVLAFSEIKNLMALKEPVDKIKMLQNLLKGQALSYFEHHLRMRVETEDSEVPDNDIIELVLIAVGLEYIPKCSISKQKYYMRQERGLYMGLHTSVL